MRKKVLIVGGVAGGATCATRLRRLDESLDIIIFEKGEHVSFANCGIPYYISEVISDREKILLQSPKSLKQRYNIDVRVNNEVIEIDRSNKSLKVRDLKTKEEYFENYDYLVLSPGSKPFKPNIVGIENAKNIFTVKNVLDADNIKNFIKINSLKKAVVIGGGFIGIEMAENLKVMGLDVTLVEMQNQIIPPMDIEMANIVHKHIEENGVSVILSDAVEKFEEEGKVIILKSGKILKSDITIMAIGVQPESNFAKNAGLETSEKGHLLVNKYLQTSDPNIYAIGDAISINDLILKEETTIPLAWPANRQGRLVADNIASKKSSYTGSLGTAILKAFELEVGMVGINEKKLKQKQINYLQVHVHPYSNATYFPGSAKISMKLLFNENGDILGFQAIGAKGVDKRVDVISTAIKAGLKVHDLPDLELAYAPQFSSAKDPVNIIGYVASNLLNNEFKSIQAKDIQDLNKEKNIIIDVRDPKEYSSGNIENSINIPLDTLREKSSKELINIVGEKNIVVYCQVGLRGYLACKILKDTGLNVYNLDGGYSTYQAYFGL